MIRLTPSTVFERSPGWSPWESRSHVRVEAIWCDYGSHRVIAACGFVQRFSDRGLGVALVKALLTCDNTRGNVPENQVPPASLGTTRGLDETCKEVTP